MGFMEMLNAHLEESKNKGSSGGGSGGSSGGGTPNYVGTGHEAFYKNNTRTFDAPISKKLTSTYKKKKKKEEDEKRSWFEKGLFEDGYDFGDISRTILGSTTDVLENLGTGIIGMGEKAVDAMAYIAPYAANSQFYQNGGFNLETEKAHREAVEQSKKDLGKFIAKDLYDEEKVARAIISDPARMLGVDSESHSVFGEKSDALIQSGGQLMATAGLAAAGMPWWATTGVTSFGSEAENAMNQGASYEEAGASAAISAGAEILSEKLSGGISFGGKTLDDGMTKMLARGISNKLGRTAAKLGLDMAGEGAEEVFSQIASNLGSSLYKEEDITELLFSEEAMDGYLESFIGGAALGGVAGGYNAVKSNRSGVDYASGLTVNEQKVVDKLYQDEIANREKEGKVTQKEKSKIYDSILEDMEKGYISIDTIEEVLGGESYSAYRKTVDSEDAILKEYDELGQKTNATLKDQARYSELTQQVKDIHSNSQRNALQAKLNEEVMGLVKGDRLGESYNERYRSGQKFEADVSKYNAKQQAVVQKAIDSGILNNSNRTHEFVDFVSKISADTGVLFDFSNTTKIREAGFAVEGQTVDGYITKDGITVNIDSPKSRQFVVGHEITHALEGTELYDALRKSVFDYAKMKNQYGVRMESIQKRYKEGTDYEAELTADLVGEYIFSDTDFIKNLSTQNRNVFQKVYDEIKYLCKVATAGSKEARELEKVKRAFENAYREGGKTQGDTKYSVSDSAGKELTAEQQEYFKDSKMRDENGNLKVMYHGSRDAGFHVFDAKMSDDGTSFFFVDRNDVAASYSGTSETYEARTISTTEDMNNFIAEIDAEGYEVVEQDGKFVLNYEGEQVATSDSAKGIYEEFCWYEGVGEGDANYKVYLNLKNPLEVDAQGRNWNNVSRKYSQEVADRYNSLTAEEKAALHDIAGWGEISIFRDEIRQAKDGALASAYEKMGDVNIYDLFTIAEDNFSEDTIKQFAVKQMNTRDYAQKAKAEGYDGVIFKNIHDNGGYSNGSEGASTVAIAFDPNQIKSVANEKPTADPDIRYSLSEDSEGRKLSPATAKRFGNSKVVDENGSLKVVFHGTASGEFTIFDKAKGSVEGDFGSGFYFTDNEADVSEHYEGGGPDFENKVARLAEQIEADEDIDYEEAEERARAELFNGSHKFEVYLNIEKPAIVGKTYLFDSEFGDIYNEEDFEDYDEYIAETEQAVADAVDEIIWEVEKNVDVYSTDGLAYIIYDAYYEGGIGLEELKTKINELYLEDSNGNLVGNEVARQIIESLGYDGIIDPTVSGKWNMDIEDGTTHYIVFKPNQIKAVTNQNPTDNPDIHRSISKVGEQHTPDSLSALRLDAPVSELVTENTPTVSKTESVADMFPDDGEDAHAELKNLELEEAEIRGVMEAYAGVGDIEAVNKLIPEHEAIRARIKELQQSETERSDSLTDADVPEEMDAPLSMKSENYDPFAGTTVYDIERSTRSYSDRNPGARRFLEEAALGFGYDVNNSTHGERWYNDHLYYESGGEQGFGGTSRHTTSDIAELKDAYGYTWDDLRKAADDVAKGDFRSVAAKRVEYLCHKRLMEGYTDVDGRRYEPNQDYIDFLNETFVNEQRAGSFDNLLENADQYAPPVEDIAPLKPASTKLKDIFTEQDAPIFEEKSGQTTMFAPEKKTAPFGSKTANVLTNEPKTPKRRSKFWSLVKEHVLDNGMVFEDLSKETGNRKIEAKWNFIRYSKSRAQRLIGDGADGVKALKDIKKEVDKSGKTGQFYDYLYHKHNVDRMSLEDRFDNTPNKAVFGDSVTSEMSQRKVNDYELANPEFMRWADDVYGYMNHLRGLLVDNGVISQETADLWEEMYPHYVPIRRAGEDGLNINVPLDTYRTTVNNPVKRATGGNQDILPLFDTMAQRTIQTYKAIARNSFGIELKNQLGSVVDTDVETVDDVIDGIDTDDALLKPGEKGMNPTFTVFEDGERVEFEITEEMYEAMKPSSEALHYRNKIFCTASSVFRGLTTQYSIPFMATNAIKDAQDVLINSQHPAKTYANFPRAWWQQATNGKWYQEYIENGGEDNTYFDTEENVFKEDSGLMKAVKFPLTAISTANNFIELTPRLSEYIASREAGRSIEVSMLDAARVTTNFAAGGDLTKFLNRNGATFLNASVQGAIQQVRNVREAHHKGLMGYVGLATKFALTGLPTVLLNNMLWDDDEDYEELADYVKQDYYVVGKYGDGKFIRIPKGRTVAVIQNAIEQVQHIATGDGEADLGAFLTLAVNNLAPNNPLENNILAPIMQVAKNQTWYGEELVPSRLQDLPSAEQFDEKTDNFSKWLGEQWDISPYKVNYLLNQYSGGIGDVLLPMMTPRAESGDDSLLGNLTAPLRDKFTTDSVINSQVVSDYYDTKDALAVKANSGKATEDDFFRDLYMDTVGWELSDLYKQKREIQNSDLPDSEKYAQSRELQEQIVERMKQSLNSYNNINASGIYAEIGDKRFNKDPDSGKWYEIKPKNADGSDNWYYQKEQEVTKGLGISYEEYWNNREEYNYAYDKPGRYAIAQAVGGYDTYMEHYDVLENWQSDNYISADKDSKGNSISGSRKKKVLNYINGLDIDYGERLILYRTVYSSKSDKRKYNQDIIDYLNERDDISYQEMKSILEELDMEVDDKGNISW